MSNELRQGVVEVLASVLELAEDRITDELSPRSCASWDSLRHLQIVLGLEGQFGCTFEPNEVPKLIDVPAIVAVLAEKGLA